MTEPFIRYDGVSKRYQTRTGELLAVDNVSLDVERGRFVSILGPSGCGKSTLLLMLAGLVPRSGGAMSIGGQPIERPYTDVGIVFQEAVLLDWRKVLDNLLIQAEIRRLDRQSSRERARQLLAMVGLEQFAGAYPYELSGGMRQRVSICRALLHDPPLLLMDEPFGALDALTRDQMNMELQGLWLGSHKTVLFVTHSIPEAVLLADQVVVMSPRPGRVGAVLDIDLPRPRPLKLRESPEFGRYTQHIFGLFETWGVIGGAATTVAA